MQNENKGDDLKLSSQEWDDIDKVWEEIQKRGVKEEGTQPKVKPSPFRKQEDKKK